MTHVDVMRALVRDYQGQVEKIRANPRLSDEGRRQEIAKVYLKARGDREKLTARNRADADARYDSARRRLFGAPLAAGSDPSRVISRRDAEERVANLTDIRQARTLLASALESGDEQLAQTIARRAYDDAGPLNAWGEVFTAYVKARPDRAAAADDLLGAARDRGGVDNASAATGMLAAAISRPRELDGIGDVARYVERSEGTA